MTDKWQPDTLRARDMYVRGTTATRYGAWEKIEPKVSPQDIVRAEELFDLWLESVEHNAVSRFIEGW